MNEIMTSLRRTPYQTFASISVLFFTLLLSGLIFISLTFVNSLLNYVEARPTVIIYFQLKADEAQISAVKEKLENSGKTKSINYISEEDAIEINKEFTKDDPLSSYTTGSSPLPASLEVDAKKPEYLPEIAKMIASEPGIDEVQFQKDILQRLLDLTNSFRKVTITFFSYLVFMSIIVLSTTLSFKIALKRDRIKTIKLLGGTNSYIRAPFVGESVFLGLLATAIANIVIIGILIVVNNFLSNYFAGMEDLFVSIGPLQLQVWPFNVTFAGITLATTAIFSLIITLISSFIATGRYLNES